MKEAQNIGLKHPDGIGIKSADVKLGIYRRCSPHVTDNFHKLYI
jgi:hypothetical protein